MVQIFSLGIILLSLLNFYGFLHISGHLSLTLSILLVLFIPGYYLTNLLFREEKTDFFEKVTLWFVLSLVFIILPGLICYIFGFSQLTIVYILILFTTILMIINFLKNRQYRNREKNTTVLKLITRFSTPGIILALIIFILMVFFIYFIIPLTCDSLSSISLVRKLAEAPFIKNYDSFYKNTIDPIYSYNIWYLTISLLAYLSKIDPIEAWIFLPAILVPLMFIIFYAFTKVLFKDNRTALACVFLLFVSCGIIEGGWAFINSPDVLYMIIFILSPIALLATFKYIREGKYIYLVLTGLMGLLIATFHLYGFTILIVSLVSFYLFLILFRKHDNILRARLLKSIFVIILLTSPYLYFRISKLIITEPYVLKNIWIINITDRLYYIDFTKLFKMPRTYMIDLPISNSLYQASFILMPFLVFWFKKNESSIFLFSNMLTPLLIILNPILIPILLRITCTEVIVRLSRMIPFLLVTGFFLHFLYAFLVKRLKRSLIYNSIFGMLLVIFLFNIGSNKNAFYFLKEMIFNKTKPHRISFTPKPNTHGYFNNPDIFMPALRFIRYNIPEDSVFLADEELSLFISAYTRNFVVAINPGYISIAANDQIERERNVGKVLNSKNNIKETELILRQYEVDYVVLRTTSPDILDKFKNNNIFKNIFFSSKIYIFKVNKSVLNI